ncbi:hypothetical protein [Streptomyces tsukubensis]|uniref:hypothetical protein n=1 Tax=Streptomyces tsukubensis TaxID=83656 RepID=UPI00344C3F7B
MKRVSTGVAVSVAVALLAVGGGAVSTAVTADGADRSAPTRIWGGVSSEPDDDPAGDLSAGRSDTPLSRLLLPVPDDYVLGPDKVPYHSNDGELDARQAARVVKEQGEGLPAADRRRFDRSVDRMGLEGMAWRTYVENHVDQHIAEVQIVQMKEPKQARAMHTLYTGLMRLLELEKGPRIEGHKNVSCFKGVPGEPDAEIYLNVYVCSAYVSKASVLVTFDTPWDLYPSVVAGFMKKQLDHIASPGEYV